MDKHKKILFVIESLTGGGAEKILSVILRNINTAKFHVTLCCIVNTGQYLNDIPKNINYKYIISNPKDCKSFWSKLIYNLKYKLVYFWLPLNWVYRLWIPKGNDIEVAFVEGFTTKLISKSTSSAKKIAWVHIDLINNHWTKITFKNNEDEAFAYSKFNDIVCVSKKVKQSMSQLGYNIDCLRVLYNPIDDQDIRQLSKDDSSIKLGSDGTIKLVSTGRLVNQKGYDRLLSIIKRLKDDGLNVSLTILGEGSDRKILEEYIKLNNLSDSVFLPGFVDNPYSTMAQHDIFVCSSRAEGYSTAVTEALILGMPVVTTDCSGMKELLGENNEYGIVTQNNDESLYQGIKELLENDKLIEHYREKALLRSRDFSLHSLMNSIEDIFQ